MIRFPVDLRVSLMRAGLHLSAWKTMVLAQPEVGPADPEILQYRFGEVHGILCHSAGLEALTIIAVNNNVPGNGDFAKLMAMLEGVAHAAGHPLAVASIWNDDLRRHLIKKRGYKDYEGPHYSDAVIKPPQT